MQRVLFIQYANSAAFPPLEHSSRILANARWQVLFLSVSGLDIESFRFPPHGRIEVRQMAYCPPGWRQKAHYVRFVLWALWWTLRWRPHWIYASDLLSCPAALLLSFLPSVRVIYHEHDSPASNGSLFVRLSMSARHRLAHRAKMCVLPNRKRAERFDTEVGKSSNGHQPSIVVWNCPSLEEISAPRAAHNGGDLWVLYHGTIVPPRLPLSVVEALTRLPERVKLCVIGYETIGHRGYVSELRETAGRLGVDNRVRFPGALVDRKELLVWCRKCDVGLSFMLKVSDDINMQAMVGASNKPFDYLSCGLALLVSGLPDWRATYVETGYGLACDPNDPESIAGALRWFLDHPVEMRAMGGRGRRKIAEEWNYESQFSPVLGRMNVSLK
jgi:glycosyltransferase involved in cell wall biosynthesis